MTRRLLTGTTAGPGRIHRAGLAGMTAAVSFVAVCSVEGRRRRGYDPRSMFVSELARGPRGWVQIATFVTTGALVVVFGRGVAAAFADGPPSVGPVLLQTIGACLVASGPFVTDASAVNSPTSRHGVIHSLFGAVVFTLAPTSCFVFARQFHDAGRFRADGPVRSDRTWRAFARWSDGAGALTSVGVGLLKVSQFPRSPLFACKGAIQRAVLVGYFGWLFAFAARLERQAAPRSSGGSPAGGRPVAGWSAGPRLT